MNGISISIAEKRMAKHYVMRDSDKFLLRVLLNQHNTDVRAALLSGPPGTGKTYFGECLGYALGGKFDGVNGKRPSNVTLYQMHSWTTNEDMHRSPNIAAFAARTSATLADEPAWIKGALWCAAESSIMQPSVLILDEVDKCMERSEHLLLEFLESGQFTLPNGTVIAANTDNLVVLLTTNETRELHEATLRRVYRHKMEFLPPAVETKLLAATTESDSELCRKVVELANKIRGGGLSSPSTKELRYLLNDMKLATNAREVRLALNGRLLKQNDIADSEVNLHAVQLFDTILAARKKAGAK